MGCPHCTRCAHHGARNASPLSTPAAVSCRRCQYLIRVTDLHLEISLNRIKFTFSPQKTVTSYTREFFKKIFDDWRISRRVENNVGRVGGSDRLDFYDVLVSLYLSPIWLACNRRLHLRVEGSSHHQDGQGWPRLARAWDVRGCAMRCAENVG